MNKIKSLFETSESILILAHVNPDGDAIGSSLSLYNALLNMHYKPDIVIVDAPETFSFLPNFDKIKNETDKEYDLVIVVDTATLERVGQEEHYFENAKFTLNIDHHISNTKYANYNYVSGNIPACCQYLYEIYKELDIEITKEVAECLVTGLLTDTGGLQYDNVNTKTFEMALELSKQVDIPCIYKKVLATKTKVQFELEKIAISRLEFHKDNKIVFTYLTEEDIISQNAKSGDYEGIVNIGREIEYVEVSIFIREINNAYKISLRGNGKINVSEIAKNFGGGGHFNAAGFETDIDFKELKDKLIDIISKELDKNE